MKQKRFDSHIFRYIIDVIVHGNDNAPISGYNDVTLSNKEVHPNVDNPLLLEMRSITRRFPGVLALSEVNFTVHLKRSCYCD